MMSSLLPFLALVCAASAASIPRARLEKRGISNDPSQFAGNTYDYVIVGCGTAGSVLANRLSADGTSTVACIEAGRTGYDDSQDIVNRLLAPALAFTNGLTGTTYDWQYQTSPQSALNGRSVKWPRGKILGGSSAINGLYLVQPSAAEYNSWASLIGDSNWAWPQAFIDRQKVENYHSPSDASALHMLQNISAWSTTGAIDFSIPPPVYADQEDSWIPTFSALGVPTVDPGSGHTMNAISSTVAVNPSNFTRSYAYTGYLAPASTRSNLHILAGYTVTKILFSGTTATGVTLAQYNGAQSYTIHAAKEVIVSAGTVGSPQLLMVSGVGSASALQQNGIEVVSAVPGVGQGLREHLSAAMGFDVGGQVSVTGDRLRTDAGYAAQQTEQWQDGDPTSLVSASNHMIAMLNLTTLLGSTDAAQQWISDAKASLKDYAASLGDSTVQAGYLAVQNEELDNLIPGGIGMIELLQNNLGGYTGVSYGMGIQAGLQRPLSRGSITLNSANIFDYPNIDPGYLSHELDQQILLAGFRYARTLSQTQPLTNIINGEVKPGPDTGTDDEWMTYLRAQLGTEYSPMGTCAMLPKNQGGVVDAQLRVYGTQNLRVVDASVFPVNLAAHGCAPTYVLGETAADIILGNLPAAPIGPTSPAPVSSRTVAVVTQTAVVTQPVVVVPITATVTA